MHREDFPIQVHMPEAFPNRMLWERIVSEIDEYENVRLESWLKQALQRYRQTHPAEAEGQSGPGDTASV